MRPTRTDVEYVLRNHPGIRQVEHLALKAATNLEAGDTAVADRYLRMIRRQDVALDPAVARAMRQGLEPCRAAIARRALTREPIDIARCPACEAALRTPQAQQCFACGHDWHD